jgi:outer membrane protein assembly factor BamA
MLTLVMGAGDPSAQTVQMKKPARVGPIFIVGNDVTPFDVVLDRLQLYPGQVLTQASLRDAERRLRWLTLLGIKASVTVLADRDVPSEIKDILVTLKETQVVTYLLVGVPQAVRYRLLSPPVSRSVRAGCR